MSNDEEGYEVIFNWEIENFDENCLGVKFCSPIFVYKLPNNTHWKFTLSVEKSPRGFMFNFELRCVSDNFMESVLDWEISIVDINGSLLRKIEEKNSIFEFPYRSTKFDCLLVTEDVFGLSKNKFLPQDTFTVRCRMKESTSQGKPTQPELHTSHIRIERSCFFWTIENFCNLQPFQKNKIHLVKNQSNSPIVTFELFFDEEEVLKVDITLAKCYSHFDTSSFNVSILDTTKKVLKSKISSMFSNYRSVTVAERDYLIENKDLYLPMGILSLQVECFLLNEKKDLQDENIQKFSLQDLHAIRDTASTCNATITDTCRSHISIASSSEVNPTAVDKKCNSDSHQEFFQNMQCLWEEGSFSDIYLLAGGSVFQAHKSILSTRSPVLKSKLLREKECDCIDIADIDEDTLRRMLLFMYSNKLEEGLQWEDAVSLYFATIKYKMGDLKRASCSVLKSSLSASNACEVLARADLYEDQELKSTAMDFIGSHDSEVLVNEEWDKFLKRHVKLASEILSEMYKRKLQCKTSR